jgi:hypothetical protein
MANYELTEAAEADLKGIALYTISKWGPEQAVCYGAFLGAEPPDESSVSRVRFSLAKPVSAAPLVHHLNAECRMHSEE